MNLLVVDTETGGLDPARHMLLSVGVVVIDHMLQVIDTEEIYIRPCDELRAEREALAVNKLSLEWLREHGQAEGDAVRMVRGYAMGYCNRSGEAPPLVGWNVAFDVDFLQAAFRRYYLGGPAWPFHPAGYFDVRQLWAARRYLRSGADRIGKLEDAARELLGQRQGHGALEDALLTVEVLRKLVGEMGLGM